MHAFLPVLIEAPAARVGTIRPQVWVVECASPIAFSRMEQWKDGTDGWRKVAVWRGDQVHECSDRQVHYAGIGTVEAVATDARFKMGKLWIEVEGWERVPPFLQLSTLLPFSEYMNRRDSGATITDRPPACTNFFKICRLWASYCQS